MDALHRLAIHLSTSIRTSRRASAESAVSPRPSARCRAVVAQITYNYRKKSRPMQAFSLERATIHQNLLPISTSPQPLPSPPQCPSSAEILRPAAPPRSFSRPDRSTSRTGRSDLHLPKPSLSGVRPRLQDPLSSAAAPPLNPSLRPDRLLSARIATMSKASRRQQHAFREFSSHHEGLLTTSRKPSRCITKAFSLYHESLFAASMIPFPSAQNAYHDSCHRASPSPTLPFAWARRAPSSRLPGTCAANEHSRFPFRVRSFFRTNAFLFRSCFRRCASSPFASISNVLPVFFVCFRQGYVRRWPRNILFRFRGPYLATVGRTPFRNSP
jgi:hypothetical protein